ncbi:MAG UNVERIFIED_CONTAM: hypothetical protein LVQ98_01505 [Rickettsiaceae bacterium]
MKNRNLLERQISIQTENVKRYSEAYANIKSKDSTIEKDMYESVQQNISNTYNVHKEVAHQMIEDHDPRASAIWEDMVDDYVYDMVGNEMEFGENTLSNENTDQSLKDFHNIHTLKINREPGDIIKTHAKEKGITNDEED